MYERFKKPNAKILVGTSFEDTGSHLHEYAKNFSDLLEAKVRLTHVNDVVLSHAWGQVYPSGYYDPALLKALEQEAKADAEKQLGDIARRNYPPRYEVETSCLTGLIADTLDADARTSHSSVILVGLAERSYRYIPKGLSTALSLMSSSHLPVIAVPHNVTSVRESNSINLVVCDDLHEHSFAAITTAVELAAALKNANVFHLHVHKESQDRVKKTARHILELMDLGRIPLDKEFSAERFFTETKTKIRQKLESRIGDARLVIEENGGRYLPEVLFGNVAENLKNYTEETRPDMLVFGRHELLHKKPLSIGKLPFYSITQLGIPILVAPTIIV
ncbi:MAG: universal stress protein [Oligoflexales bacterium]